MKKSMSWIANTKPDTVYTYKKRRITPAFFVSIRGERPPVLYALAPVADRYGEAEIEIRSLLANRDELLSDPGYHIIGSYEEVDPRRAEI